MRGKIPIREGARLCKKYRCPVIVCFAIEADGERFTVMTYGETKKLCKHAADLGKKFAEAVMGGTVAPAPIEPTDLPEEPTEWIGYRGSSIAADGLVKGGEV